MTVEPTGSCYFRNYTQAWIKREKRHTYLHKDGIYIKCGFEVSIICIWGSWMVFLTKDWKISGLVLRWIEFAFKDPRWYSWHPSSHAGSNLLCSKCHSPGFSNKCQSKQYISQKKLFCKCWYFIPSFHLMLCLQAWKQKYFFIRQTFILEVLLKGCWVEKVMIKLRAKLPFYVCVQI